MKQKIYKVLSVLLTLALVFSTCICSVSADEAAQEPAGPKEITYYVSPDGVDTADGLTVATPVATVDKAVNLALAAGCVKGDTVYVKVIHVADKVNVWTTASNNMITAHEFTLDVSSYADKAQISEGAQTHFNGPTNISNIKFGWGNWKGTKLNANDVVIGEGVETVIAEFNINLASANKAYDNDVNLTLKSPINRPFYLGGDWAGPIYNDNVNITVDIAGNQLFVIGTNNGNAPVHAAKFNAAVNVNIKKADTVTFTIPNSVNKSEFGANSVVQIINSIGANAAAWKTALTQNSNATCKPAKYYIINNKLGNADAVAFTGTVGKYNVTPAKGYVASVKNEAGEVVATTRKGEIDLSALPAGVYDINAEVYVPKTATYYVSPDGSDTADGLTVDTPLATVDKAVNLANAAGLGELDVIYVKVIHVADKVNVWTTASNNTITAHEATLDVSSYSDTAQISDGAQTHFNGPTNISNIRFGWGNWKGTSFDSNDVVIGEGLITSGNYNVHLASANKAYNHDVNLTLKSSFSRPFYIGGDWAGPIYNGNLYITVDIPGNQQFVIGTNNGNGEVHAAKFNAAVNFNIKNCNGISFAIPNNVCKSKFGENSAVQIINSTEASSIAWESILTANSIETCKPPKYYIINNGAADDIIAFTDTIGKFAVDTDTYTIKATDKEGTETLAADGYLTLDASGTYTLVAECIEHIYTNDCDVACDRCEEIDETRGHIFTNYVSNNDATCTDDGTKTATCDREGCEEKDTIADLESALGHLYDNDCDASCNREGCTAEDRVVGDHKYSAITDPDCDSCGVKRELGNQFVEEADGKYHYYNEGVHSKVTDLVKIDGKWLYLEEGVWANTVDTLHKINGKWFLIKKGIWTATTGLTEYKGKTFYVVGGKWNSNVNDLKKINGKWYFIKSGKWDSSLESLHKLNGKWFLVKGGMWKATTGLVKYQGKQFYVVGGKWESRTGVYKISGKNYFIKGGKWDKTITTLYKKSGKLLSIKNGMWTKSKAIIKYSGKKYYCDDGYAQTKKTGKVTVSGKTYTVKKGIVK